MTTSDSKWMASQKQLVAGSHLIHYTLQICQQICILFYHVLSVDLSMLAEVLSSPSDVSNCALPLVIFANATPRNDDCSYMVWVVSFWHLIWNVDHFLFLTLPCGLLTCHCKCHNYIDPVAMHGKAHVFFIGRCNVFLDVKQLQNHHLVLKRYVYIYI